MRDVLVLCYHGVSATWPADISIAPDVLDRQVRGLLRRGYRPATFTDAVTAPPHRKTLAVTFDDAYRNVLELGLPVLERLGVPATVFAPTALVGRPGPMSWPGVDEWLGGPHEHELTGMGWDGLRALRDAGWEVGSHSRTHPHLARIDVAALRDELAGSKAECEDELGVPCRSIAYPYGNVDATVVDAARAAGYAAGGAVSSLRPEDPFDWPRLGVWRQDAGWRFHVKAAALTRRARLRLTPGRYPDA